MAEGKLAESEIQEVTTESLTEQLQSMAFEFSERIAELELDMEDVGWEKLSGFGDVEFSRAAIRTITRLSRIFYLKNPLIKRAVDLKTSYVFGQGVTIQGAHPLIDQIVQAFLDDEKNKAELTRHLSMSARETDLQIESNLFFMFFGNEEGLTRIRTVPFTEIADIISNPEDAKDPWFYVRKKALKVDHLGNPIGELDTKGTLYPDWQYRPAQKDTTYEGMEIDWSTPIYHVKVNALNGQRFGVSELYSAHDWARAYNEFLSNWATITRALARFAWRVVAKGGADQRAAIKARMDSNLAEGGAIQMPTAAASTMIESEGAASLSPIRTAGATTSPQDGRRLLLMVCAATGIYEHYFGDPSTGNLATAKSMERPMELMFLNRQMLWQEVFSNIIGFAVEQQARSGKVTGLTGSDQEDQWGEMIFVYGDDPDPKTTPEGQEVDPYADTTIDTAIEVMFPDLVEADVVARVAAVHQAASVGVLPAEYVAEQLLSALGERSVKEVMDEIFPDPSEEDMAGIGIVPPAMQATAEKLRTQMTNFMELLKEAKIQDGEGGNSDS